MPIEGRSGEVPGSLGFWVYIYLDLHPSNWLPSVLLLVGPCTCLALQSHRFTGTDMELTFRVPSRTSFSPCLPTGS